ncbi:hypothetical protein [Nevskia soli]|uniref:hypothetical protein n=1 Tax=Nevskia soli TaxID=418856 RepID=UPI0012F7EE24|nr:hypothetical protein [Nevskia soli]
MPESIDAAVAACAKACTEESSKRACDALLWAAGNNHAGTYGPSALTLVDGLEPVINSSAPWAQRAALEAMIDLYGSFESESGEQLARELRQRIASLEPEVIAISKSSSVAAPSALALLELLHEPAPN